jgi:hypothetical protein
VAGDDPAGEVPLAYRGEGRLPRTGAKEAAERIKAAGSTGGTIALCALPLSSMQTHNVGRLGSESGALKLS